MSKRRTSSVRQLPRIEPTCDNLQGIRSTLLHSLPLFVFVAFLPYAEVPPQNAVWWRAYLYGNASKANLRIHLYRTEQ